jgi:hypothetical protein
MATLQAVIKGALTGDVTLMATLTGGIFDASVLDREGLDLATVQDANGRLKPCGVLRWRGSNPIDPAVLPAEQRFLEVWLYEDQGTANIETAKRLIKALLHYKLFQADNCGLAWLEWAGDLGETTADELGGASADRSRFAVTLTRK